LRLLLLAALLISLATPAAAHPHIFIDAKATIVFNDAGEVVGVRHAWTFDEAFSIWQIQGLDTDGDGVTSSEEMQGLADESMQGLAEYQFYTFAGEGKGTLPMASMDDARLVHENGRSTLSFGIEPQGPYRIEDTLEVAVNDPEYYVAITFADASSVTLENAPAGCGVTMQPPRDMPEEVADQLYSLPPEVTQLPPELAAALRGVQGAILVKCAAASAEAAPETAAEAVTQVAQARPTPFGGPPPEPGFTMPKTGFLGWIAAQQREFYQALTEALGRLKADNNAFWVLGSLSFFYGIFHAAGPGHGKVVISSYVLANERQVRRGIALSFAAAMLQAAVAVAFVLVAQLLLNMTSFAMSDAANWIGIASYGLVALLGVWLIGRKVFGWGHGHRHEGDLAEKARAHLHGHDHDNHDHKQHDHAHIVTPELARGDWREQLGVVLAVGARPCSGALVVLVFALSQGLLAAGIASVFLMALGTAITVAVLATLAVSAKGLAVRLAGGNGGMASGLVWWGELAGAMLVFGFGVLLLLASI
jgi:nickel/cobalt exporter